MAKKLDLKKMFLERGEVVGLALAGGVGLLLVVTTMFRPGRGLFSPGAESKIKALKEPSERVQRDLSDRDRLPSEGEKAPSLTEAKGKLVTPTLDALLAKDYPQVPWVHGVEVPGFPRSMPKVLNIMEAAVAADTVPLQSYIVRFAGNKMWVRVLKGDGDKDGDRGDAIGESSRRMGRMFGSGPGGAGGGGRGRMGGMPGGPGGMGGEGGGRLGMPGQLQGETKKKAKKASEMLVEKLNNEVMAEQIRPVRMAVIGGSFPLKKQVEEFQKKLRLPDETAVLSENAAELTKGGKTVASFRFLGVKLQRRELDRDGNPLKEGWDDIKFKEDYAPYVIATGQRFEEDDPALEKVRFPGLAMKKLMQFRAENVGKGVTGTTASGGVGYGMGMPGEGGPGSPGGGRGAPPPGTIGMKEKDKKDKDKDDKLIDRYPKVESQLAMLQQTLKDLESKDASEVTDLSKSRFGGRADLFDEGIDDTEPPPATGGTGGTAGAGGLGEGEGGMGDLTKPRELPEYCLVRVIDVTVEAGKTYEYRLKVVMANPNWKRADVASAEYATKANYLESEWSTMPIKVEVQDDLRYFAVDQRKLEGRDSKLKYFDLNENRQLVLQAHRFLSEVDLAKGPTVQVGNWAVAERFAVYKGEYVGRSVRVELPVWKFDLEDFLIATDSTTNTQRPGIEVSFAHNAKGEQAEAILVDFDNGNHAYDRVTPLEDEKVDVKTIRDQCHIEALILNPDGKLILREGAIDSFTEAGEGQKRDEVLEAARKRVSNIKKGTDKPGIDR